MKVQDMIEELLLDAAYKREVKPYKNVYMVKILNPGDRINIFISFRIKTSKGEVLLCRTDIDLEKTENNVRLGMHLLTQPMIKRESICFFKKSLTIGHKSIADILKQTAAPTFAEKIAKVESMYETE